MNDANFLQIGLRNSHIHRKPIFVKVVKEKEGTNRMKASGLIKPSTCL